MRPKKLILLSVGILLSATMSAQSLFETLKVMKSDFAESSSLEIVMQLSVFDEVQSKEPHYQQMIHLRKDEENYWYHYDQVEMLMNDHCMIMVNKGSKTITYSKRDVNAEREFQSAVKLDLDSILSLYQQPVLLETSNNISHFVVKEKEGPIEDIHFYISSAPVTMRKIAYKYRAGQYVTIEFLVFDGAPSFEELAFSEKRYLKKVEDKWFPTNYFRHFRVQVH